MNPETKNCQNCKKDFIIEPDDFSFYKKMEVPPPTFCPPCRFQRRLSFRNNRVFYKRECAYCKKELLSLYSSDKPFIVYCRECWLSDNWDPMSYSFDYDFSKSFFEQFRSLQVSVPRVNMYQTNFVSSEYCNYGLDLKDCYLMFGGIDNERVYFGNQVVGSKDSMDIAFSEKMEFSYEVFECQKSNNLFYSSYCEECVDSYYLIDCKNCINCFGCVGLRNKQYCIFNEQYSKEDYRQFVEQATGSFSLHQENLARLKELDLQSIHRYARVYKSLNSTGDDLSEARNTKYSFSSSEVEDSKYLFFCRHRAKDCYDTSFQGFNAELLYEIAHGFGGAKSAFGIRNFSNQNSYYNEECHDCSNIFGCEGLRKKQYCILNKQYTKEEYEELVPRIIEHMNSVPYVDSNQRVHKYGEFFPYELSPFSYNETIAQEYFPLIKEQAVLSGLFWKEVDTRNYKITLDTEDIPDLISSTDEAITNEVIRCAHKGECIEQCTEAFKITSNELQFYQKMNIPLPRLCPNCRHYERLNKRNPLKLWHRACMCELSRHSHQGKCKIEFETSYAPDRPEKVYCEKCYQQEVV